MQLKKGKRYEAQIKLKDFKHILAPNSFVANHFKDEYGFADVVSTGSGANRTVTGTWPGETQEIELNDARIVSVKEV